MGLWIWERLDWTYAATTPSRFISTLPHKYGTNAVCTRYISATTQGIDKTIYLFDYYFGYDRIAVYDSAYTGEATFKNAMSGVYLVYELATPTWEKTNPFTNPQTVGSTEEFVANLPVGHESKYYDGDIHHSYIYRGDARAKVTGDVDIVNGTAPNGTCSVCVVMPDGDEIWSDAGDVTAEIWT